MSTQRFILLSLNCFSLILEHSTNAEQTCQEFLTQYNHQQVQNLGICTRTLNYKSGVEKVRKSTCILKCTMERLGLINEDGAIMELGNLQIYIEKNFPKPLQSYAAERFRSCLNGSGVTNDGFPNEDTCKQYEPFIKCITTTYRQLCRSEPNKRPNTVHKEQAVATGHTKQNNRPENILHNLFYIAAL